MTMKNFIKGYGRYLWKKPLPENLDADINAEIIDADDKTLEHIK